LETRTAELAAAEASLAETREALAGREAELAAATAAAEGLRRELAAVRAALAASEDARDAAQARAPRLQCTKIRRVLYLRLTRFP